MNIFMREMKAHGKSLIIWSICIVLMIISTMTEYAGFSSTGQPMENLFAEMPESLKAIVGIGSFDLSKASGYYGVLYIYLLLMATIHAAMLGAGIISKEERDKTAEFLMVKPVPRSKIIISKLVAVITNTIIFNMVTLLTSVIIVGNYSTGEEVTGDILKLMLGMFILQLMFMVVGTAIAGISKNPKRATGISTGILLITFILSIVIDINSKLSGLKYLTPFKYFEAKNLMYGGSFDLVFVAISVVLIAALTAVTFVFYNKRDINV